MCTTGPYRYVHPGYVGALLVVFAVPLIVGSRWAFAVEAEHVVGSVDQAVALVSADEELLAALHRTFRNVS